MSNLVMTEVWERAPVSGGELLLLLRLADASGDDHRMSWESVPTLAARARMSERNAFLCLKKLTSAGIIETVDDDERPEAAKRYTSTVRRITEADTWEEIDSVKAVRHARMRAEYDRKRSRLWSALAERDGLFCQHCSEDDARLLTIDHIVPIHKEGTNDLGNLQFLCMPCNRAKGVTIPVDMPKLQYAAGVTQPPTSIVTSNWLRIETSSLSPTAPTRRKGSRKVAAQREPEPGDYANSLEALQDDPEPEVPVERPAPRTRQPRSQSPAEQVVALFKLLARQNDQNVPGATNDEALRGSIQRWLNDGSEYNAIVRMVENYWEPTFQRAEHKPAYVDFLAQRGNLAAQGHKTVKADQVEEDRHNAAKWGA